MILEFTVEAIFPVSVGVASGSGSEVGGRASVVTLCWIGRFLSIHAFGEFFLLKSGDLLVIIAGVALIRLDCRDRLLVRPGFPLSVRGNLVHVIQSHGIWVSLSNHFSQISSQCCPVQLHL
jgi:hypothetical protein